MRRALNLQLACQAMALKVSANLVVQLVRRRISPDQSAFDPQQVVEFAAYGFLGSQVGNVVQFVLEDWFPSGHAQGAQVLPDVVLGHRDRRAAEERKKTDDSQAAGGGGRRCFNISPDIIWRNVLAKLVLDQTVGLFVSGCVFLICTNVARVPHPMLVFPVVRERIWPLIKAGWHLWPLVAICNFLWVPVRSRVLVAVCVGFGWSIFLSIFAARK